jgi:hypothetical protein
VCWSLIRFRVPARGATIYPYLLEDLAIERPNQVSANGPNFLRRREILAIATLDARTLVPYAGIRCSNAAATHRSRAAILDQDKHMNSIGSLFKPPEPRSPCAVAPRTWETPRAISGP